MRAWTVIFWAHFLFLLVLVLLLLHFTCVLSTTKNRTWRKQQRIIKENKIKHSNMFASCQWTGNLSQLRHIKNPVRQCDSACLSSTVEEGAIPKLLNVTWSKEEVIFIYVVDFWTHTDEHKKKKTNYLARTKKKRERETGIAPVSNKRERKNTQSTRSSSTHTRTLVWIREDCKSYSKQQQQQQQ